MNLKLEIDIKSNKTWQELCGGKIKTIIHHHLNKMEKDLKTHIDASMSEEWYVADDSNCDVCVFSIENNNNDYDHLKNIQNANNQCAMSNDFKNSRPNLNKDIHNISKNCNYFIADKKYIENLNTLDNIAEFKKQLL